MPLILGLDLGTSSLKALLLRTNGEVAFVHSRSYRSATPRPGWIEQDPKAWEDALGDAIAAALAHANGEEIAAIGFSGHMSGVVLVDRDGTPVCNCITLSDNRSEEECRNLSRDFGQRISANTGNPVINAFSAPKLLWLQRHRKEAFDRASAYLAPKDYLRYILCGEMAAELTDAANSLLLNRENQWDFELIRDVGLPERLFLPLLTPSQPAGSVTKRAAARFGLRAGTPVIAGGADMACGALGTGIERQGDAAVTIGTSATFLCGVSGPVKIGHGAVTFHPHALPDKYYALGSHFNGGLALNWISMLFSSGGEIDYKLLDNLAEQALILPPTAGGLLCLPYFIGSGSPYFSASDSATFLGISQVTGRAEIFKSLLEGIAYNLRQTMELFERINGAPLLNVCIGGGGIKTAGWPQVIVDVFGRPASTIRCPDASAVGAAVLGGYGAGLFTDMVGAARKSLEIRQSLSVQPEHHRIYNAAYRHWLRLHDSVSEFSAEMKRLTEYGIAETEQQA